VPIFLQVKRNNATAVPVWIRIATFVRTLQFDTCRVNLDPSLGSTAVNLNSEVQLAALVSSALYHVTLSETGRDADEQGRPIAPLPAL
jgi:hypothetical protein